MKHLLLIALAAFLVVSCKKEMPQSAEPDNYLEHVKNGLEDSLSATSYSTLDFSKTFYIPYKEDSNYLRISIKGKKIAEEFAVLITDKAGKVKAGRFVSLYKKKASPDVPSHYNGDIIIRSLEEEVLLSSPVVNGKIIGFRTYPSSMGMIYSMDNTYQELPEVIVVGTRSSGGISFSDYIYLRSLFGTGFTDYSNEFSLLSVEGGDMYGWSGGGGGGYVPPIQIDFETQQGNDGIILQKYIDCFNALPDVGSDCSIEILSDIPVDSDPNKLFNYDSQSPGHTFIQITKTFGGESVMQNIGFYPETNWKAMLSPASVAGKFVDNGGHEFNASLKMNVSPEQLRMTLNYMKLLSEVIQYDIDEFNCTDFALQIFNYVRPANKLEIPKYNLPGTFPPLGTSTPQGLYNKLKEMQQNGNAEASNISIPGYKGWVANSKGPCN